MKLQKSRARKFNLGLMVLSAPVLFSTILGRVASAEGSGPPPEETGSLDQSREGVDIANRQQLSNDSGASSPLSPEMRVNENPLPVQEKPVAQPDAQGGIPSGDTAKPQPSNAQAIAKDVDTKKAQVAKVGMDVAPISVGVPPTAQDLGGEADMLSIINDPRIPIPKSTKWNFSIRGYIRAPLRVGIGPRNDLTPGSQWHSPARIPGMNYDDWGYTGLAPRPEASFYLSALSRYAAAYLIIGTQNFPDSGYMNLVKTGGISQGYVVLRHPDLFGDIGGVAWTVGAFSNRYGNAGPNGWTSGYYGTQLFGRTHVAGETLTASLELPGNMDLVLEHGFGAKIDVTPYIGYDHIPEPPLAPYLPQQGVVAQGSNFVHHAHASLGFLGSIKVSAHYLRSWSSGDCGTSQPCSISVVNSIGFRQGVKVPDIYMNVYGGDLRIDHKRFGNGYIGYSKVDGRNLYSLANGLEVLHGDGGLSFAQNYFGPLQWQPKLIVQNQNETIPPNFYAGPKNDNGAVQTVLFQYQVKASSVFGRNLGLPDTGWWKGNHDVGLAIFGMYNRVTYEKCTAQSIITPGSVIRNYNWLSPSQSQGINNCISPPSQAAYDRLKFGADLQLSLSRNLVLGTRFDRVMPTGFSRSDDVYSAISPRLLFRTAWISREYIVLGYTRYFYATDGGLRAYGLGNPQTQTPYLNPKVNDGVSNYPTYSNPYPFGGFASDYLTPIDQRKPDPNLFTITAMVAF